MADTSGPAFPVAPYVAQANELSPPAPGMSLRDYFAAQALAGGLAEFYRSGEAWDGYDDFARSCYTMADAMLRARAEEPPRG